MNYTRHIKETLFLFAFLSLMCMGASVYINADWVTYGPAQIMQYNPDLYTNDFVISSLGGEFSPQYILGMFSAFLQKWMPWEYTYLLIYFLSTVLLFYGIIRLVQLAFSGHENSMQIVAICCAFYGLCRYWNVLQEIGGNSVWKNSLYHQSLAFALSVIAIYNILLFCYYKPKARFLIVSYVLLAMASAAQILVGFYMAGLATLFILSHFTFWNFREWPMIKKIISLCTVLIYLIPTVGIYLLVKIQDETLLTNAEFVEIYAKLRTPHHENPESWAWYAWLILVVMAVIAWCLLWKESQSSCYGRYMKQFYGIFTVYIAVLLLINWVFIDVVPLKIVAAAQPARIMFVYSATILFIVLMYLVKYHPVLLVGYSAIVVTEKPVIICLGTVVCFAFVIFTDILKRSSKENSLEIVLSISAVVGYVWYVKGNLNTTKLIFLIVITLVVFAVVIEQRKRMSSKAVLFICTLILCVSAFSPTSKLLKAPFEILYQSELYKTRSEVAEYLEQNSDVDDVYMADPFDENMDMIRLLSRRAQYVSYKAIGYNDAVTVKWLDRMENFGSIVEKSDKGKYKVDQQAYANLDGEYLLDLAKKNHIEWFIEKATSTRFEDVVGVQMVFENAQYKLYFVQ